MILIKNESEKPGTKKWRLRFSLRSLLLLPLLVALYFLLGTLTRNYGEVPVKRWLAENRLKGGVNYECPLVFSQPENMLDQDNKGQIIARTTERYYLWLFGPVVELPYTREYVDVVSPDNTIDEILRKRFFKNQN